MLVRFQLSLILFMRRLISIIADSKHLKVAVLLSVLNIIYCIFIQNPWIFIFRQSFIIILVGFSFVFKDELKQFSQEDGQIDLLLKKKYPVLKAEKPLFIGSVFATIFVANCSQYTFYIEFHLLLFFSILTIMCFIILTFYKAFCIVLTPEVRVFFKPSLSLGELSQKLRKGQFREVTSAIFSKTAHGCKFCGKLLLGTGGAVWVGPKILSGDLTHRGELMNELTYPYNGYKVRSEVDATRFQFYIDRFPEEKESLLDERGYVKPLELDKRIKEKELFQFQHEHHVANPFPKGSLFNKFPKKD